jgi:predicted AAA+ superfamily ATPase
LARQPDEAAFWATHHGAEIDLILRRGQRLFGLECKRADAPRMTPSIRIALEDLGMERVAAVYPGDRRYLLHERVEVVPLRELARPGALFSKGDAGSDSADRKQANSAGRWRPQAPRRAAA